MQLAGSQPGIIPPDVLIAASSLKDKAALLDRMKEAQQAQAQAAAGRGADPAGHGAGRHRGEAEQAQLNEARANDLQHASVQKVAQVHKHGGRELRHPGRGAGGAPAADADATSAGDAA
jgi:hypothetical protein